MNEHKERISNFIDTLESYGFTKTLDKIGEYSSDADLYYRKIDANRYLIFNHYAKKHRAEFQGFDCWIGTYNSADEIGVKKAQGIEQVRLSFQIERDWPLVSNYL